MINTITQDSLYLILPYKVSQLAMLYAHKCDLSVREAISRIYQSQTYRELEDESTKLWNLGPAALLEHLQQHG